MIHMHYHFSQNLEPTIEMARKVGGNEASKVTEKTETFSVDDHIFKGEQKSHFALL